MLGHLEIREMNIPSDYSTTRTPNYLIQRMGKQTFYVHRELSKGENLFYEEKDLIEYKDKMYLYKVSVFSSEEKAENEVKKYWKTINNMKDRKPIEITSRFRSLL